MLSRNFCEKRARENFCNFHTAQCGKARDSLRISLSLKKNSSNQLISNFFSKTIAFTEFLRKKGEREFLQSPQCALWNTHSALQCWKMKNTVTQCGKTRNSLTWKIFRQINSLVTYLVKPLLSRNFCQKCVGENSRNFHTNFFVKSTTILVTSLVKALLSQNFCQKNVRVKIS